MTILQDFFQRLEIDLEQNILQDRLKKSGFHLFFPPFFCHIVEDPVLVQLKILRDFVFVFVFFLARPATECVRSVIDFRSSFVSLLLVRFRRVADCHTNGNQSGKNRQMCKKDREEEGSEKEGGGNTHTKNPSAEEREQ